MTFKLTAKTRSLWAEKTFDLINIGAGATLFGQFISEKNFSMSSTILGLILVIIGYIISYFLLEEK